MQERRKSGRARVQKSARLVLTESQMIDCFVFDLTNAGAGTQVFGSIGLPDNLDLTFDVGRTNRPCRLVWRRSDRMGVQFL